MNRIHALNNRYKASAALARNGVELIAVADPTSAQFNSAVRRLIGTAVADNELWESLVGPAKMLRWRLLTQPQPSEFNQRLVDMAQEVVLQARRLRGAVSDQDLLEELIASAGDLADPGWRPQVGTELLNSCLEIGVNDCVVIAANKAAQCGLAEWLNAYGLTVMTLAENEKSGTFREQAYVVGPPRFYRPSVISAPITEGVSFVVPAWFGDRRLPQSVITPYADGAIQIKSRVFEVGDPEASEVLADSYADEEDSYLPKPVWAVRKPEDREPTFEEVEARKILLSGGKAIWLDSGARIRAVDPLQPEGERVIYTEIDEVREGTYLLLRQGTTERGALYQIALAKMGNRSTDVEKTQAEWKDALSIQLRRLGPREVARQLRNIGVKAADQAKAWNDSGLIRPHRDEDFELLLDWLGIRSQPTLRIATQLRKMVYKASSEVRKELEHAISNTDLSILESVGHISLDAASGEVKGILATRVIAISPFIEIVPRYDVRVPFDDRSGQWLE